MKQGLLKLTLAGSMLNLPRSGGILFRIEEDIHAWIDKSRNIQVALIGNPNSGKTTLFNLRIGFKGEGSKLCGSDNRLKRGSDMSTQAIDFSIVDLPGTYSLKSYSPEEVYLRNYIFDNKPDVVVNIIDASNLETQPISYYAAYRYGNPGCDRTEYV
ncbi:MAG: 50S ribosome-binding GTPase [Ignavibacteriales bacterium]|nr:50S ribosome-binding GTPase [Ignavibacteriales bacterium]